MPRTHKYGGATVTASTQLVIGEVQRLVVQVVDSIRWTRIAEQTEGATRVVVWSRFDQPLVVFTVHIWTHGGRTNVRSVIDDYATVQQKAYFVIPIGPKEMIGFPAYKDFMERLARAVTTLDSGAHATVVTRASRTAGG